MSPRFQFSLRSIFWLTTIVAVVLGTMTALGNTHSFRALGSVHAYLALLPIAGVWVAWQMKILSGKSLLPTSTVLYVISLILPSIGWDFVSISGIEAIIASVLGLLIPEDGDDAMWRPFASCIGLIANGGFISNLFVASKLLSERPLQRDLQRITWLSLCFSLLVLFPLGMTGNLTSIYIGYGFWVTAMLAMWLGVRQEAIFVSTSAGRTGMDAACQSSTSENPDEVDSRAD